MLTQPPVVHCYCCSPGCASPGIGVAGQALGSFMLSNEMLGPTWRGVAGILTQVGYTVLLLLCCLLLLYIAHLRRCWHVKEIDQLNVAVLGAQRLLAAG